MPEVLDKSVTVEVSLEVRVLVHLAPGQPGHLDR